MTGIAPRQRLRPDERRQRLIAATLRTLARHGAKGAGVRQVCRELGVAPSLVAHFFAGWSDLLAAAYDAMADELLNALERACAEPAAAPRDRLRAMIECYLSPEALADDSIGAYLALWALSRTDVDLRAAFARFHEARTALFLPVIRQLAGGNAIDTDLCARSLVVVLDGFWLELGTNPGSIPREQAVAMGMAWVEMQLAGRTDRGRTSCGGGRSARPRPVRRPGAIRQPAWRPARYRYAPVEIVSADAIEAIHAASLTILETMGMRILSPEAREILRDAGAALTPAATSSSSTAASSWRRSPLPPRASRCAPAIPHATSRSAADTASSPRSAARPMSWTSTAGGAPAPMPRCATISGSCKS